MNYRYLILFIFGFFFVYFVLNRKTELQVQKEVVSNKIKTLVVHVTREFQPLVTYGGLGSVLGSIAKYQTESQDLDSWIIIPFYTFLSFINRNEDKITEVTIQYKDRIIIVPIYLKKFNKISVFFVGGGDEEPFDRVFETTLQKLYATPSDISSSLREGYFNLAASKLIVKITKGLNDQTQPRKIDYLHVHGSTNGLVIPIIHRFMGNYLRPPIIYTMHDYNSEWTIINLDVVRSFYIKLPSEFMKLNVMSISKIALQYTDVITCVSKNMKTDLEDGKVYFAFKDELIMKREYFYGVPNAVSDDMQPTDNSLLKSNNLAYIPNTPVLNFKRKVKDFVARENIISFNNDNPIILYIGRFELDKGIEFLPFLASLTDELNFNLIVMGYYVSYFQNARDIIEPMKKYQNVRIIDSRELQQKFGYYIRVISDFFFVPSKKEGFGLVAAEGQSIGSIPIVSNIGGLRDIVLPFGNDPLWTGFMFSIEENKEDTEYKLKNTIKSAVQTFTDFNDQEKEYVLQRLLEKSPKWRTSVDLYMETYKKAEEIKSKTRMIIDSQLKQKFYGDNILKNPSFENTDPSQEWIAFVSGFQFHSNGRSGNCIKMENKNKDDKRGAQQEIYIAQESSKALLISGWSKSEKVEGKTSNSYSISVDIVFNDQSTILGYSVDFTAGTHPWEYKELLLSFEKPIKRMVVSLLFRDLIGTAYFDDVKVMEVM